MLPFLLHKLYSNHGLVVILLGIMVLSLGAALSKEVGPVVVLLSPRCQVCPGTTHGKQSLVLIPCLIVDQ